MNIANFSIKNSLLIYVLTLGSIIYGLYTYNKMGKLEDPEFTIKDALVITNYPGANAIEVEKELTNKLEDAIQELPFVKRIKAKSSAGQSLIIVRMKDKYSKDTLPQIWDQLRKKINDAQASLPPRAKTTIINDDFGDVYGIVFAIWGDEYTYDELNDYVDFLKKELILVDGVGKIDIFGKRQRAIYIEFNNDKLAKLGINKNMILKDLYLKNLVANYGKVKVGSERILIKAQNPISKVEDIGNILIKGVKSKTQIFLKDIATIKDDYLTPARNIIEYNGHDTILLGISTISGGNVVKMGKQLDEKLEKLKKFKPLGMNISVISHQAQSVNKAINSFMINLIQAVAIVVFVLLVFMGIRSGLIIGFVLLVTILGTFIFMPKMGLMLERVSLGALIVALGMLVDNAIVIVDGILVRINQGIQKEKAANEVVNQTAFPLLAATAVAILAFGAIGLSEDTTGEYTNSLFWVIFISLGFSWITAVTLTPILAIKFLKVSKKDNTEQYSSFLYRFYGRFLRFAMNYRYLIVFLAIGIFLVSLYSFKFVKQNFFPDSSRPQILIDYYLPQGSAIESTKESMDYLGKKITHIDGIKNITTFIGQGGPRFLLTYAPTHPNSAYAQMLIDIKDYKKAINIITEIENITKSRYPDIVVFGKKVVLGPGEGGKVQAKIFGKDLDKLRLYEEKVLNIFRNEPLARGIRSDWSNRVKVIKPVISDEKANLNGISRDDIAQVILDEFQGRLVGVYKDGTQLVPIIVKSKKSRSENIKNIQNIQIYSPMARKMIPLKQLVSSYKVEFIDDIIYRYNRKRAITIHADPILGKLPNDLLQKVKSKVESLPFEDGYYVQWHGEYKESRDAQKPIIESLPIFASLMFIIVLALFNSIKKTLIIWFTVPFSLIGVVIGLLVMNQAFGFMSMLGFLSLSGMLIKNAIVLIDEITLENEIKNKPLNISIYKSGLNRLRAVTMAALTTALGMIPLLSDVFFSSMATVIIFGLMVATFLTMFLVPVFYCIFYKSEKI